jgi:hypothetical protein
MSDNVGDGDASTLRAKTNNQERGRQMRSENKTIKMLLSGIAFLLVLNLGANLIYEKTAKAAKPVEYSWTASGGIYPFSTEASDSTTAIANFTQALNSMAKSGWRVSGVASGVSASDPSALRIYAILER